MGGSVPPPHPHIHYAGGCCPLLVGWLVGWLVAWVGWLWGRVVVCCNNAERKPCPSNPLQRKVCDSSCGAAKSFKLKVIKNFAVFDYF